MKTTKLTTNEVMIMFFEGKVNQIDSFICDNGTDIIEPYFTTEGDFALEISEKIKHETHISRMKLIDYSADQRTWNLTKRVY